MATNTSRLGSSRRLYSYEETARAFLVDLKDSVGADDEAEAVVATFNKFFKDMRRGKRGTNATRALVANFLTDEAPIVLERFVQLFESCRTTNAWAGVPPPPDEDGEALTPQGSIPRAGSSVRRDDAMRVGAELQEVARPVGGTKKEKARDWQLWAKRLVPEGRGSYAIWFTICNSAVIIGIFAYMAGDYGMWVQQNQENFLERHSSEDLQDVEGSAGRVPAFLFRWLKWTATWQAFSFQFLKTWGGRFAPLLRDGDWWLWFTSFYVHQSLQHIVSNMLLFVAVSVHLELNYGWWRLLLVWFISGLGANLVSATFEDLCTLLVGASGAIFGFMGLFVADLIVNFESIAWPFVRLLTIVLFVVFFVANALIERSNVEGQTSNVSHASHIGGLICGLFPSMLFLPNLRDKRLKAVQRQLQENAARDDVTTRTRQRMQLSEEEMRGVRASFWTRHFPVNPLMILGAIVVVVVYVALPIYLYQNKFDQDTSDCDTGSSAPVPTSPPAGLAETPQGRRLLEAGEVASRGPLVLWG